MNTSKILTTLSMTLLLAAPFTIWGKHQVDSKPIVSERSYPAFTEIAKNAIPATVFIKTTINAQPFGGYDTPNPFDMFSDEFFRKFFRFPNDGGGFQQIPQQQQVVSGSGFFVSADGYIVTNYHVVKDAATITIVLNDGREFPATVIGSDSRTDLAVLKISETGLPYLTLGDSDELQIGEWAIAIGSPCALESSLTVGVISAKGRQDLGIASLEDFIQTDAAINPGNSGGPLLNLNGQVIGVNTAFLSRTGGYMGIGFSIPSQIVRHVIDQIMNNGGVHRVYLGVILQPIDKDLADALGLDKQEGVLISDIVKNSPASKAGLQQGDIILQYNNKTAKSISKFSNDIAMMDAGQIINLKVLRKNSTMDLRIPLEMQSESEQLTLAEMTQKLGIEVENATPEMASRINIPSDTIGVVITKILPGSPAQMAGLKAGLLITGVAVQGNEPKQIKNTAEFDTALKEINNRKHVILIVRHQNYQRYYTIKIN